jgi:hypothetical protein
MALFIFRSLGIAVANDFTPIWGSNLNKGHEWFVLFSGDTTVAIDIPQTEIMNRLYKYEALPKVYRRTFENDKSNLFSPHSLDVTQNYRSTANLKLPFTINFKKIRLAVFNKESGWLTVDVSRGIGIPEFRNIGKDIVYGVFRGKKSDLYNVDALFYLNDSGTVINLKADKNSTVTAILTRKHPLFTIRQSYIGAWAESINGFEFQGGNKRNFSDAVCLFKINNHSTSNSIKYKVNNNKRFKCYRIINPARARIHISDFNLISDSVGVIPEWEVLFKKEGITHPEGHKVVDYDPLTSITTFFLKVNYYFEEPVNINEFRIQARTDDNDVTPGNTYELMYWDEDWISAGVKVASDTLLVYENIPGGTLYWLKNHTKGRQEHVFLLDENGHQYWPGVTSVKHLYRDFLNLERLCNR